MNIPAITLFRALADWTNLIFPAILVKPTILIPDTRIEIPAVSFPREQSICASSFPTPRCVQLVHHCTKKCVSSRNNKIEAAISLSALKLRWVGRSMDSLRPCSILRTLPSALRISPCSVNVLPRSRLIASCAIRIVVW
jgi:hypothetical protein